MNSWSGTDRSATGCPRVAVWVRASDGVVSGLQYDYRAVTADGAVLAVRAIDHTPQGDLGFWVKAIENQMRRRGGYALIASADIKSADGVAGKKLTFGHDEMSTPHVYTLAIFVTGPRIFLVEAGAKKELMAKEAPNVDYALAHFRTRH
jgi:hypothetical protein